MHRIDGARATPEHLFQGGNPSVGLKGTQLTADWLNDVQENLMAVLAAAGVPPTKGRSADLLDALLNGATKTLDTIADLQALGLDASMPPVFRVRSYYAGGGGGGGVFWHDTASTDAHDYGATIVDGEGRRWKRQWAQPGCVSVSDYGCPLDGEAAATIRLRAALAYLKNLGGGQLWLEKGTLLTDDLWIPSGTTVAGLHGRDACIIKFAPHSSIEHSPLHVGDGETPVSDVVLRDFTVDGNAAAQTGNRISDGVPDEWSHGIRLNGASKVLVTNVCSHNTKGDNIYVGGDDGVGGGKQIMLFRNEFYGAAPTRQCVGWVRGTGQILYNACAGNIDVEVNDGHGSANNILIQGNIGRGGDGGDITSTLRILVGTHGAPATCRNTRILHNHMAYVALGSGTIYELAYNTIVGSSPNDPYLATFSSADRIHSHHNRWIANMAVATGLDPSNPLSFGRGSGIIDDNVCPNFWSHDEWFDNETATVYSRAGVPSGVWRAGPGNVLTGSGKYHSTSAPRPNEPGRFRIDVNAGVVTATQISGVPLPGIVFGASGANLTAAGAPGGHGSTWQLRMSPMCNASAAAATAFPDVLDVSQDNTVGSTRVVTGKTRAAGGTSWTAFNFGSGTGTFLCDVMV